MAQVPRVGRGQKRVYDPLELELEMVVYDHVGIRTQAWVLWKDSKWSELRIHLYSLIFFLILFIMSFVILGMNPGVPACQRSSIFELHPSPSTDLIII